MSQRLISLSEDLKRLRDEGYHLEVRADLGLVLLRDVPYVTADKTVRTDGVLVSALDLAGDVTVAPSRHTLHFTGAHPCDQHGRPLDIVSDPNPKDFGDGLTANMEFSRKPTPVQDPAYANFHEKLSTYAWVLAAHAQAIDPAVTPQTHPVIEDDEEDSVFVYVDTASSRAGIGAINDKLKLERVGIVGLGGTGSYVFDLVSKTPIQEIHLFDGDILHQHNAFRAPGAPDIDTLRAKPTKVAYLSEVYSHMRRGIVPHPEFITEATVEALAPMDFVFLCLDAGDGKRLAVECLEAHGIPFVDVGLGVQETNGSLGGVVRVTTSTPDNREAVRTHVSFAEAEANNEYAWNIQIADLNALNASLAVIRWKKQYGFYRDLEDEHHSLYTIDGNHLLNEELGNAN